MPVIEPVELATAPEASANLLKAAEIVEIIGMIGLNVWRNLFNLIAQTSVDFPPVKLDQPLATASHV